MSLSIPIVHRSGNRRGSPGQQPALPKTPSGIAGLDDITGGGLPRGRPTLVCGGPDCGKTLFAAEELAANVAEFVRSRDERQRLLSIIKSRGMAHSTRTCEVRLTHHGVEIVAPGAGAGALSGSPAADGAMPMAASGDRRVGREAGA